MRALVPALAALLVAGCLQPSPAAETLEAASVEAPPAFAFTAEDCEASGFVAPYHKREGQKLAGVWELADIREEIGNPIHDGVGMPVIGPLWGNWHIGVRCAGAVGPDGAVEDFAYGWVGQMVEPPAWDEGGADLHFLLTGLAFEDGVLADGLRAATTMDVTPVVEVRADWEIPKDTVRSYVYTHFEDAERGLYQSWSTMGHYRDLEDRTLRFWWQVPADGSEATSGHHHSSGTHEEETNPVFFDVRVGGGAQHTTPRGDGVEFATHNMLKMEHGPVLTQPCVTVAYEQPTLAFEMGRVVTEVVLDEVWTH